MSERRWSMTVQDARGRRLRGHVMYADALPARLISPALPARFAIWLIGRSGRIPSAPAGVAVCVASDAALHTIGGEPALPRSIADLTLPRDRMAAYASGRIEGAIGLLETGDVFPAHSDRPRLDRLALALIETAEAEAVAPYTAVIRHEFGLRPGEDALGELASRLAPDDAASQPPARAPGVMRLTRALRALQAGGAPKISFEQLTEDLRFLRLFEPASDAMTRAGMRRLLDDVLAEPAPAPPLRPARITPLRRPKGDA